MLSTLQVGVLRRTSMVHGLKMKFLGSGAEDRGPESVGISGSIVAALGESPYRRGYAGYNFAVLEGGSFVPRQ